MRANWEVKGEKYRGVTRKKQPDILILESGLSPVIIETEIEPANTLAADIMDKLGEKTQAGHTVSTVIGIKIPARYTKLTGKPLRSALLFHDRAAHAVGQPTRYELTSTKGGNSVDAGRLLSAWRQILSVDYYPIFNTAVAIVEKIGSRAHNDIMVLLFDATERIFSFRLQGASDLYGEIFQETISERKKLAANYTRPECAMLLSSMALPPTDDAIWKSKNALTQFRIADFACGTGILLLSAYKTMALRYKMTSTGTAYENKVPPHHSCDVVIMNPPYSGTKSPGGRDDESNPGILFAAFGVPRSEQRLMTKRANMLFKKKACASPKAGLATFFMDLAHEKLKPGGKIGLVLPMTAATGTKWKNFRGMIAQKYTDVRVVSIRGTNPAETSMSGGTEIAEILIAAKKCGDGERPSGRGLFLSLEHRPKSNLEAVIIGSAMLDMDANKLEDGPRGGSSIMPGTSNFVLDYPLKNNVWGGGGVEDYSLLQIGHLLDRGILQLSHKSPIKFDVVRLGAIASMGVSHLQIAGLNQSNKESVSFNGPFKWPEPITSASKYPVFWGLGKADTMKRKPSLALSPIPGSDKKRIEHVRKTASHVHIRGHLRTTSERLCFSYTDGLVIGGNLWPSVCIDAKYAKALVLWGNSALGVLCRWQLSGKQHLGRSLIGLSDTRLIPVPNFSKMAKSTLRDFDASFDKLCDVRLDTVMNMWKDPGRKSVDSAVLAALGARGLEAELDKLRRALCREPTINGGNLPQDLEISV